MEITTQSGDSLNQQPDKKGSSRKWVLVILLILAVTCIVAAGGMVMKMNTVPDELDTSTSLVSENGLFRVSYSIPDEPRPIKTMQSWILHVETPDGLPVENAQINVDGDMPQHGHGLPTRPQMTEYLGNGDYKVEGLKFHMQGWWIVEFDIAAQDKSDHVTFNLVLTQ